MHDEVAKLNEFNCFRKLACSGTVSNNMKRRLILDAKGNIKRVKKVILGLRENLSGL